MLYMLTRIENSLVRNTVVSKAKNAAIGGNPYNAEPKQ